jgi:predicted transcriptional regulator
MEVNLTPEQEAQITQIAGKSGTDPGRLVKDVLARYLDGEARFLAAVERGLAAAERGEFIEEEEMDARIERMFSKRCCVFAGLFPPSSYSWPHPID